MRRPLLLAVLPVLALGCLIDADLDPRGYRCVEDGDCAEGLVCRAQLCADNPIQPLLRLRGPSGSELLLFESEESRTLIAKGFISDGPVILASTEAATGFNPVYRLHNPSTDDYLLARSTSEVSSAQDLGFVPQGIAFYGGAATGSGGVPVTRVQLRSFHHYPVGETERDAKVAAGWQLEFVVFRGERPGPTSAR